MKFIDSYHDQWHTITGEDGPMVTLTPAPYSLLNLSQWHAVRHSWPEGMPVGVALGNTDAVDDIVADLPRLQLVALNFPKWVDGRAYTQARLLRSRYRFAGEVRATGEVLVDMMSLLKRTGFNAVVLRADQNRESAERALAFFGGYYQGDALDNHPIFERSPQ